MTDYMNEVKRLAQAYADAVLLGEVNDEALAALLAHIQRGAVPEGWRNAVQKLGNLSSFLAGWKLSESCIRNGMGTEVSRWIDGLSELYKLYAAPAPDQFRAAGEAAGYARAANWLRAKAEKHAEENGYHEPDTGSFVFAGRAAEEWNNSVLELADEMEAALRGEVKP